MDIIRTMQPDIMLGLGAICGMLALLVYMTKTMSQER